MRVVVVINSLGAGGTERSTAVLLPYLRERGIDVTVACLLHREEGDEAGVRAAGFDVRVLPAGWPARLRALRALVAEVQPAVLHTAIFEADVAGRVAAVASGVPVLTSLVNTPYTPERFADPRITPWKLRTVQWIDGWSGRVANAAFHAVTEGVAADAPVALGYPRTRIAVVERGRDPEALGQRTPERRAAARAALVAELGLGPHEAVAPVFVLTAGRQEFQKDHVTLVEAVARLGVSHPELHLLVAGRDGNASTDLDAAIERTGSARRVHRLGHRADIAELLCAADVFALSSRYEGTAGAVLEAFALEAPVVATDLDGTRGLVVDGENALTVPVADPAALAAAIVATLAEPEAARRRTDAARALFLDRFTLDRSADAMADLYRAVAARGPRRLTARPARRADPRAAPWRPSPAPSGAGPSAVAGPPR